MVTTIAFGGLGATEVLLIAVGALLIFGKRLPEVGRSLGKGLIEFKKGLRGIEEDLDVDDSKKKWDEDVNASSSESDLGNAGAEESEESK